MTEDVILAVEKNVATKPAARVILSRPGKERNVTDVLNTMAAFRHREYIVGVKED